MSGKLLGYLEVIKGADTTLGGCPKRINIYKHSIIKIGRSPNNCNFVVNDPQVSSIHCVIWSIIFDENSLPMFYLKDYSLNGTFLNENLSLKKDIAYILNNEDVIILNNYQLRFTCCINLGNVKDVSQLGFQRIINNWEISNKIIGVGTFGHVMVAYKKNKNNIKLSENYAVKIIKLKPHKLDKEANILLSLDHPNIIKVHYTYCDLNDNLYIFQDLIPGGDLFSYLAKSDCLTPISETETLLIVYQILKALNYLHLNGIVHRDLKLDNILLCSPETIYPKIVLADFGIAKTLCTNSKSTRMFTIVGTPEYCAPEVGFKSSFIQTSSNLSESNGYDKKCDIWSLGVITHIMLTGISPFYGDGTEMSIVQNTRSGKLNFSAKQWETISSNAKDFVRGLLKVDVTHRMDSGESLNHSWLAKHKDKLELIYFKKILNIKDIKPVESQNGKDVEQGEKEEGRFNWKKKLHGTDSIVPTSLTTLKKKRIKKRV